MLENGCHNHIASLVRGSSLRKSAHRNHHELHPGNCCLVDPSLLDLILLRCQWRVGRRIEPGAERGHHLAESRDVPTGSGLEASECDCRDRGS